ncbi:hypothetical protein L873DRAFT_917639 [Choiromyces venosus 120613-1]|uniref:Uncharacterized protein n=1 Tax=Choiromyces venosus 120613-1 TaxID=1336337 RepID=A0A3N4JPY3_9PEZI|nr:hypothetical protein L873DRAFT_917639 [Choiromyces venosus 120613-1]
MLTDKDIRVRCETMFRVGITLGHVMESIALNPGNLMLGIAIHKNPNISMVESVEWAQHSLNAISLDDDRILKLDTVKDLQPLANIHNILTQFKGSVSLKNDLYDKLQAIQMRLGELQESMIDSIHQAAAEVHDFVRFATFVVPIHPRGCTLTSESIRDAEILALQDPIFRRLVRHLSNSVRLYDPQTPIPGHRLSKARELPPITKFAMEENGTGTILLMSLQSKKVHPPSRYSYLIPPRFRFVPTSIHSELFHSGIIWSL